MNKYSFLYCQKIVVFSRDMNSVLLCKRKDEEDYDKIYTFIGGKMEVTDKDIVAGMQREKNEEVGESFKIELCPQFSINLNFQKKNGDFVILPHYYSRHLSGDVNLNEEYSNYKWVDINSLSSFEPKIDNIPKVVKTLLKLKAIINPEDLIIV